MSTPSTSLIARGTTLQRRSALKRSWSPIKRTRLNRSKKASPRRVANERKFKARRRVWRAQKGHWPAVDAKYREWLKTQPCVVSAARGVPQKSKTEVAHVGLRGAAQKCSDYEALPLSREFHRRGYPESHHTLGKRFWVYHGLDRQTLIDEHLMRWRHEQSFASGVEFGRKASNPEGV